MEGIFDLSQKLMNVTEENLENNLVDPTNFNLVNVGRASYPGGAAIALNEIENVDLMKSDLVSGDHVFINGNITNNSDLFTGQINSPKIGLFQGVNWNNSDGAKIKSGLINVLERVDNLLGDFVDDGQFDADMGLAFGDGANLVKAKELIQAWTNNDVNQLPQIEVRPEADIAGGQGAFAEATNTIYLGQDFVRSHLGNTEKIAGVMVEEFGHFLDSQINSIEAPGDEGEIFADLVEGKVFSADQFLAKQKEDDWAIAFLNGEKVGIEQAEMITQKDNLDFLAKNISNWSNLPIGNDQKFEKELFKADLNLPAGSFDFVSGAVTGQWQLTSGLEASIFATAGSFGNAEFSYPIDVFVSTPKSLNLGENFTIKTGVAQKSGNATFDSGTTGAELPNAGLKFVLNPLTANIENVNVKTPIGEFKDVVEVKIGTPRIEENIDFLSLLKGEVGDPLEVAKLKFSPPEIKKLKPKEPNIVSDFNLPEIMASGESDSIVEGEVDLDKVLALSVPPVTTPLLGLGGEKEFSLNENRINGKLSYDLLDIKARLGLALQQEFTFDPDEINVTLSLDGQSTQTGTIGDEKEYMFTAPLEGCGLLKVKAQYELTGALRNVIGVLPKGSVDITALEGEASINVGNYLNGSLGIGPLFSKQFPEGGNLTDTAFPLIGSPARGSIDSKPLFPILNTIRTTDIKGIEITKENPDGTKNLIVEVEYEIPYNMPVSIDDATIQEGNTGTQEMIFKVTRREVSDQPLTLEYTSDKGSGSVTIEAGQATADIKIPIPGDEAVEDDEEFTVTLKDPQNQIFAKCKDSDGNPMDKIEATGTVIDDDFPEPPLPPGPRDTGDPHLITTDGKSYDFQGAGEFNLIESNTSDLKIQARKEPINNDPLSNVSVNTAVATILGGKRVGIYPEGSHLLIDGNPVEINDNNFLSVDGGKIYREGNTYTITYPSGDKLQAAVIDSERLDIGIYLKDERQGQVRGLLGNFNNNPDDEIAKRDGTVLTEPIALEQLYGEFSDSWRVAPNESLFDYKTGEDTNTFTLTNYPRKKVTLSDLNPADLEKAYELIGDRINEIDPNLREGAIIDFVLSGFKESYIESAIAAGAVSAGSVVILDELGARDDFAFTNANLPIKLDILSNDTVNPGTPLAITSIDQTSTGGGNTTQDNNGTPDDPSDDQLFYTPPLNFTGIDRFKYTIFDGNQPSTAIVNINIPNINLANLQTNQGVTIKSTTAGNFTGVAVNQIGDINGDQIADIASGAFAADPNGNNAAGETYVLFGTNQPVTNNIDPNTLNGTNGFTIKGMDNTGFSGGSVASAGDINQDGIDDIIIGAFGANVNGQNNAGKAYVIYGSRNPFPASIDVSTLNGANGFALTGLYEFSYAGVSVGQAGDFNQDGIDDLFINAPGPLNGQASKTYVLLGNATGFPPSINLGQPNNVNTITIDGLYTQSGGSVSSAGDVNKDGASDLIIGADTGGKDSYIVYGSSNSPNTIYLYNLTNGTTINGIDINNENGTNVSGIGDVNQDGIDDVIVSANGIAIDGTTGIGKGYVIFGRAGGLPTQIDVTTLNGTNGFTITGTNIDGTSTINVSGKGDFNKDGIADIILGKPNDNANAGNSYVVFGSKQPFPANIDLANLNGTDGLAILGTETDDLTGVSVASGGDVNKDTIDDIVIGAPGNLFNDSPGKSYVVFGDQNFGNTTSLVFDENYYLANNPEVNNAIASGVVRNALDHFSKYGVNEGRNFQIFLFNEKYYLQQNPEVDNLIAQGVVKSGLEHFTKFGQFEGRKPSPANETTAQIKFDEKYYLTQNPEVKELIDQRVINSGFEHFLTYGQYEGRKPAA